MFCNKCGAQIADGSIFCSRCGCRLSDESAAAAEQNFNDPGASSPADEIAMREAYLQAQRATTHYGKCKDEVIRVIDRDNYGRMLVEVSFTAFGPLGVPATYIYYVVIQNINSSGFAVTGPRAVSRIYHRDYAAAKSEVMFNNNWNLPTQAN